MVLRQATTVAAVVANTARTKIQISSVKVGIGATLPWSCRNGGSGARNEKKRASENVEVLGVIARSRSVKTAILYAIQMYKHTRQSAYIRQRGPFIANVHTKSLYSVPLRTSHRATSMKNYEIGRLAEGVLKGAKLRVIFERKRSLLEPPLVFEREQLYRPPGDPF